MGKIVGLTFPTDTNKIEFTAPDEETVQQTEVPNEEVPNENEEVTNKKGGKK